MNLAAWVLLVLFVLMAGYAHMLYLLVISEREWIDRLLEDPKATLQAMIDMEDDNA